ncbi:MAG: VF530 family protein [Burkholderiaceae bacterium]|nr:VF530 family protein [Burkholderiaceae bacterium]
MNTAESTPTPTPDAHRSESATTPPAVPKPPKQPHNPLHGVTLESIVVALSDYFGWEELGHQIPIRCFQADPSVKSSLTFLRKTPWAREKVESLYLFMLREQRRSGQP